MASRSNSKVKASDDGLIFEGVIDHQTIPGLLENMPEVNSKRPVLDLAKVSKIDSAGLAFLIHLGNTQFPTAEKLSLVGLSTQAKQLIDIMGLETVFEFG